MIHTIKTIHDKAFYDLGVRKLQTQWTSVYTRLVLRMNHHFQDMHPQAKLIYDNNVNKCILVSDRPRVFRVKATDNPQQVMVRDDNPLEFAQWWKPTSYSNYDKTYVVRQNTCKLDLPSSSWEVTKKSTACAIQLMLEKMPPVEDALREQWSLVRDMKETEGIAFLQSACQLHDIIRQAENRECEAVAYMLFPSVAKLRELHGIK